ncbi:thiazole biosynthesis adenylyltransferase ThiF [Neobacillus thermocopriae]|uniref:Thiazole biosynthesis adenylyltransferase ThiF n=1 Tax=Neobacillus thermocopriae TaxID=1215031 RepID=A0A6B3TMW6_9BACI|nr:thiazole biosynthesis adenylyltransferase ThiF [Neobacillus thermocopriae]MED3624995.1 thiazole biosynthesis adenylyltransferase ThiF [Neobacillus thermocopriae]MED3713265.1 thiazole biosynthesis adenylyltransferase ThiF [Neobacillus thermocopriae]NEX78294.1 thiazole biosynthesis adenylyltransferase ThiF [Neobacillus thermocopriae]
MNERYSRQILFSGIGREGQEKIRNKHVLIIGAGALGSGNAEILTRAGVGKITIIDRDYVEESNLQRQQLYTEEDVSEKLPKAAAAEKRLRAINSDVEIRALIDDAIPEVLEELISDVNVMIDATDNFETRMIINDISQKYNVPWIYGACVGSFGMSFSIIPGKTPCLNCLLRTIPLQGMTCDTGGIISPTVQMVISHQTAEALKILVEDWEAVRTSFVSFDLWRNQYTSLKMGKAKFAGCLSCGEDRTYPYLDRENMTKSTVLCGRDTVQIRPSNQGKISLERLATQLLSLGYKVKGNPYLLSVEMGSERMVIFQDGRALIHGTKDLIHAKTIYQRILG